MSFLSDTQRRGSADALRTLNLAHLAGRPVDEILAGVAEVVCPDGGTIDEGIARRAFMETISEVSVLELEDLDSLTESQMSAIFESFATNAILGRILHDIGAKAIVLPESIEAVSRVERQIRDYIRGAVHDAISRAGGVGRVTQNQVDRFVVEVYESAFSILGGGE